MPAYLQLLTEGAVRPTRGSAQAAGLDLYSTISTTLYPGQRQRMPTGIAVAIAPGYAGLICPRSGIADQHGITVLNSPGIVDSDYRGEIGVLLINHGSAPHNIKAGDRIAQLVIVPVAMPNLVEVNQLPPTRRGSGGFGHTGA